MNEIFSFLFYKLRNVPVPKTANPTTTKLMTAIKPVMRRMMAAAPATVIEVALPEVYKKMRESGDKKSPSSRVSSVSSVVSIRLSAENTKILVSS